MNLCRRPRALLMAGALAAVAATAQTATPPSPGPTAETQSENSGLTELTAGQLAKIKTVLAAYKPATLTADDAKAIKRSVRDAGMRRSLALDKAITQAGFSPERLEVLDPRPAQPPPGRSPMGKSDAPGGVPPAR